MRYNVSQLLKSQTGTARHYQLHEDIRQLDAAVTPLSNLDGEVTLLRTADGVLATGNFYTTVEVSCSRCLDMFATPIRFNIEEEFHPSLDVVTGAKVPVTDDDEAATRIDVHHILDLTEVVRQDLLLAMPMHPVCRSACKGLCPNCGQNWNVGPCNCDLTDIDPRLAVLKNLLSESK